ncbi:Probable isoaspartyl peptidase/L-asparaginase 2 [Linum perenne]
MGGWAIAVHGGAGVDPNLPLQRQEEAKLLLTRCLNLGISSLRSNLPAIDVVELVVRELETDPLFNSGRGSALTEKGTLVENDYFITEENVGMLKLAKEANSIVFDYRIPLAETCGAKAASVAKPIMMNGLPISVYSQETVGCVVVDSQGRCAAATSTGGLMNKKTGRIGDSPLIGAGTYAGKLCGVSCTGEGEAIIRGTLARDVAAVMEYKGLKLQAAVNMVIKERLDEGKAGLIAVSNDGEVACGFNTNGMFRGCATEDGFMEVGIW